MTPCPPSRPLPPAPMASSPLPAGWRCRPVSAGDAASVAALERMAMPAGKVTGSTAIWQRLLRLSCTQGLLIEDGAGNCRAYCIWQVVAEQVELLSIAVHPAFSRKGLGSFLLDEMAAICRAQGAGIIFLEVAENNTPARQFYEKKAFVVIGRRPRYYRLSNESFKDAILMSLSLAGDMVNSTKES
ncbi:MAG: GNAT family N-acetyltransferase [Alphaproteobacteria bacterium]|nr:MAG: GNAT family N-acetyltransferase [Alphaproteobacteria bacterium]